MRKLWNVNVMLIPIIEAYLGYDCKLRLVVRLQFGEVECSNLFIPNTPRSTQTRSGGNGEGSICGLNSFLFLNWSIGQEYFIPDYSRGIICNKICNCLNLLAKKKKKKKRTDFGS